MVCCSCCHYTSRCHGWMRDKEAFLQQRHRRAADRQQTTFPPSSPTDQLKTKSSGSSSNIITTAGDRPVPIYASQHQQWIQITFPSLSFSHTLIMVHFPGMSQASQLDDDGGGGGGGGCWCHKASIRSLEFTLDKRHSRCLNAMWFSDDD